MKPFELKSNAEVELVFTNYPEVVREKMLRLRALVLETAKELEEVTSLEETLKWGEPSYLTKHGSTLRMDWKEKSPNQYAMYFKCTSRLVETFKVVFKDTFDYEGNRAIVFQLDDQVPKNALKKCIKATLSYHKVKKLSTLGIQANEPRI
ncbi:protein of unknown function (DU1801) [Robiginitalea myxolifaciens]|uniref:YdhG-like domain-containing protein n=1 Tax=Robiginitalea myxolifaciens TaxID=400055 RepID=A0A1I6HKZ8_9FLAO|nr:DUF1801 domain-containing protein [Robiginitalea myxolifaciens]SFR55027.1 protein of unknown function (DU1801) [Robiginitalea myxolifaciens]